MVICSQPDNHLKVWVTNFPTCTLEHYFSHTHLERGHREGLLTSASLCSSCSLCHLRLSAWCRLGSAISSGPISKGYYTAYVYAECNGYTVLMTSLWEESNWALQETVLNTTEAGTVARYPLGSITKGSHCTKCFVELLINNPLPTR